MRISKTIVGCALTGVIASGGVATAASLITSSQIKDGTIQNRDIERGAISLSALSPGTQRLIAEGRRQGAPGSAGGNGVNGANGADGAPGGQGAAGTNGTDGANGAAGANGANGAKGDTGAAGAKGDTGQTGVAGSNATVDSGNWGTVNRNTIGAANAELRSGPAVPPLGRGSLNLNVGDAASKIAYGTEADYRTVPLSEMNTLGFSVYQTGEDASTASNNLPNLAIEVDPTGPGSPTAPNFTTLVSITPGEPGSANKWRTVDAVAGQFYLTGRAGTDSSCNQTTSCSLTKIKEFYPNASLLTVQISKGRDFAFHGSVDALKLGADTVNFEETGVTTG